MILLQYMKHQGSLYDDTLDIYDATTCSASPLTFILLLDLHKQAGHDREASYLERIQVAWILMHEVRPPQLDIRDFENSRWLSGGGHRAAVLVYQRDLEGDRGRALDPDAIFHET